MVARARWRSGSLALVFVHYHTPRLLIRAVRAARADLAASGLDADIIVVDNGSHEADARRLAALPVDYVKSEANLGYAGGINRGVARTGASHLMFLNADVEVWPGCLLALRQALTDGAAVAGPRLYWDEGRTIVLPPTEERTRGSALAALVARAGVHGAAWLRRAWRRHARRHWRAVTPMASWTLSGALLAVRRDAWERTGPFDEAFKLYFEETDWLHRCRRLGLTSRFVPGAAALHRYNQSAVQQPLAGAWFAESSRRFASRHHGAWFVALERRLARPPAALPAVALPSASTPPALDLAPFQTRARGPLWIEISPSPSGIPAAGCRVADASWRLPDDVWRHLAPGTYLLHIVDDAGRELGRYAFRRSTGETRAEPAGTGDAVTAETGGDALRRRPGERWPSRVEAVGIVAAAEAASPGTPVLVTAEAELPDAPTLSRALRALHARLGQGGRLFWTGPPAQSRALRVALPEAGFVVERRGADGGAETLDTRADRFVVRDYQDGDEARILPLFRASFGVGRGPKRWAWQYRDNPYGAHRISGAFEAGGRLVAHYAGYPVWFHRAGAARLPALQIGDTMTARDVRHVGRGPSSLLGRTVAHFYARFCEDTVAFNYGFNTATAQGFSLRFAGARKVEPVAFACRDARAPWPAPALRDRVAGGFRVEPVRVFDAAFDDLFTRVRDAYALLIERDGRYLGWRYGACPDGGYLLYAAWRGERLVGWAVFRLVAERLVWGDALFDPAFPGAAGAVLARAAADHPAARTIEGWLPPRPAWWGAIVRDLGFEPRPEPEDLSLMTVPFGWDPEEAFRERLYYTKGDSDLF